MPLTKRIGKTERETYAQFRAYSGAGSWLAPSRWSRARTCGKAGQRSGSDSRVSSFNDKPPAKNQTPAEGRASTGGRHAERTPRVDPGVEQLLRSSGTCTGLLLGTLRRGVRA